MGDEEWAEGEEAAETEKVENVITMDDIFDDINEEEGNRELPEEEGEKPKESKQGKHEENEEDDKYYNQFIAEMRKREQLE